MARKHSFDEVRKRFEQVGCKLISESYHGTKKPLEFICSCGNKATKTFNAFMSASWCKKCEVSKRSDSKRKYDIEDVRKLFNQEGCLLLSKEYINTQTPLDYVCSCGEISTVRVNDFKKGVRCNVCGQEKRVSGQRHTYDYVSQFFKTEGCTLLSSCYKNSSSLLSYVCSCGSISKISFNNFKKGQRCKTCGIKKQVIKQTFNYEHVKGIFEENGCVLLENTYVNSSVPMKYKCSCGNVSTIRFNCFQRGRRCKECGFIKVRGENHPSWKHSKSLEERIVERSYPEYYQWRTSVFERDQYTCQGCGKVGGKLVAHHLDGYNWCVERRTDITNGATLCEYCHDINYEGSFHNIYGNGDNTKVQYEEWIQNKRNRDAI